MTVVLIGAPFIIPTANASLKPDTDKCVHGLNLLGVPNTTVGFPNDTAICNALISHQYYLFLKHNDTQTSCHSSLQCFVCTNLLTNITGEPQPYNLTSPTQRCDSFQYN
jgi:hypothetical protein